MPGGFAGENKNIDERIQEWVRSTIKSFEKQISIENERTKKPLTHAELNQITSNLFTDTVYTVDSQSPHYMLYDAGHQAINELKRLAEIAATAPENSPISRLVPKNQFQNITHVRSDYAAHVKELKHALIGSANIDALLQYCTTHKVTKPSEECPDQTGNRLTKAQWKQAESSWQEYKITEDYFIIESFKALITSLEPKTKARILKSAWPDLLEKLIISQNITANISVLFKIITEQLSAAIPDLANWLLAIPEKEKISFVKKLIAKNLFPNFSENQTAIKSEAYGFAIETGHLNNLEFSEPVIVKNRDLRGIKLDSANLAQLQFDNCDLRLTGIESNPTLQARHFRNNAVTLESALPIALKAQDASLLKELLDNPECTKNACMIFFMQHNPFTQLEHPDVVRILATHDKTAALFRLAFEKDGDFIDVTCLRAELLQEGLQSSYYHSLNGIRTLQAALRRLNKKLRYSKEDLPKEDLPKLENAIIVIKQKLVENHADEKHLIKTIVDPTNKSLTPQEIYASICMADQDYCTHKNYSRLDLEGYNDPNSFSTPDQKRQWSFEVLNNRGQEIGRLISSSGIFCQQLHKILKIIRRYISIQIKLICYKAQV